MSDLTYAKINLDNLTENYGTIKRMTGDCRVICVVKADAYGHGVIPVVRRLRNLGASFFAVANLSEALQVRAATRRADILILGYTDPRCADILRNKARLCRDVDTRAEACTRSSRTKLRNEPRRHRLYRSRS